MKTHADIVDILQSQENALRVEFGVHEIGIVSSNTEYKPVSSVRCFFVGVEPARLDQLKSYLETELDMLVELVAKESANGAFRYAFPNSRQKRS